MNTMIKITTFISILTVANSYSLNGKPATWRFVGSTPPAKEFDPLGIAHTTSEEGAKWLREAELAHSRYAMLAFPTLLGLDLLDSEKLAINQLSSQSFYEQFPFWFGVACFEVARMFQGWENPFEGGKYFSLKKDYQPGHVLSFMMSKDISKIPDRQFNSELNNGRLAMLATVGYIAQEYVENSKIFG